MQRQKWINGWQEDPTSSRNKRYMKFLLQWRFRCTWLKWLLPQNEGNFGCNGIDHNCPQSDGKILIGRGELSGCSRKSIRWHWSNGSFLMVYSNSSNDNYCKQPVLRQPVPKSYSPKHMLNARQRHRNKCIGPQHWPLTIVWNFCSVYVTLRLNLPHEVLVIRTVLQIGQIERYMVSLRMNWSGFRHNSPYPWFSFKLGGRQLVFRSCGKP